MSYYDVPEDELRCVCSGENVRCRNEATGDDHLCDFCRTDRARRD